jgi:hypothetical protein
MESIMLFWTLFTACNTEDPVAGSIRLCLPEDVQPSMETEEPNFLRGSLLDIREGSGDCTAELVFQTEEAEHVIGYSILDPEGNDASFIPSWTSAENVTLSTHISFVFGMSYGLVLEDDSGIMLALDEGTWGGALQDAELPFEVGQSENDIGSTEQECMTKTGFALTIGDDELLPFGEFDIAIDEQNFTFIAVSAVEYGPGTSCSISDMSDEFAWGIFKE